MPLGSQEEIVESIRHDLTAIHTDYLLDRDRLFELRKIAKFLNSMLQELYDEED